MQIPNGTVQGMVLPCQVLPCMLLWEFQRHPMRWFDHGVQGGSQRYTFCSALLPFQGHLNRTVLPRKKGGARVPPPNFTSCAAAPDQP